MPQEALILAATPWNNSAPGNLSDEAGISNPFPPRAFIPLRGKTISRRPLQPVPRLIEIAIALFTADGIPALSNEIFRSSRKRRISLWGPPNTHRNIITFTDREEILVRFRVQHLFSSRPIRFCAYLAHLQVVSEFPPTRKCETHARSPLSYAW